MKPAIAGALVASGVLALLMPLCALPDVVNTTSGSIRMAQIDHPPGPPPTVRRRRPSWPNPAQREEARVRIGLTVAQSKKIEQLYQETARQRQVIVKQTRELYHQLRALYDKYDFDHHRAALLRKKILALHQRRLELFSKNEERLRKIMNRQQFDRMRAMIRQMWRKSDRRHGQPPGVDEGAPPPDHPR